MMNPTLFVVSLVALMSAATLINSQDTCTYSATTSTDDVTPRVGGLKAVVDTDQIATISELANQVLNANTGDNAPYYQLTCLKSAQSQVVSGNLYRVKATFIQTDCTNDGQVNYDNYDQSTCKGSLEAETGQVISYDCTFGIHSQPWLNSNKLVDFNCNPQLKISSS
jgi:hypothetical protein